MTVDYRALVSTNIGTLMNGSGLSEDHAQDVGLISYKGTFLFGEIIIPPRGYIVETAIVRPQVGLLTRFYPRLHVISSSADPYARRTTVQVGCQIELMRSVQDRLNYLANGASPIDWWNALSEELKADAPPQIEAKKLVQFCLSQLGITLASGSVETDDMYLKQFIDLSGGYIDIIDRVLFSNLMRGWMLPSGQLFVERVSLEVGTGPVLTSANFEQLLPISGATPASERCRVTYEAVEPGVNLTNPAGFPLDGGLTGAPTGPGTGIPGTAVPWDRGEGKWPARDWTLDESYGSPTQVKVTYTGAGGAQQVASYGHIPGSKTLSKFITINWTGPDGRAQGSDVKIREDAETYKCLAEANSAYGTSLLSAGFGFSGSTARNTKTTKDFTYGIGPNGPTVEFEVTEEFVSYAEFVGSLSITEYVFSGVPYDLGGGLVLIKRTEVRTDVNEEANITKRATTTYTATGRKQSGNQGTAAAQGTVTTNANLTAVINAAMPLVCEGTLVNINTGREAGTQSRPNVQQRAAAELDNGIGRETVAGVRSSSGDRAVGTSIQSGGRQSRFVNFGAQFSGGTFITWSTAEYNLPMAPDTTVFIQEGSGDYAGETERFLRPGGAQARALALGQMQNQMAFGHSNGSQLITAPWLLPDEPFRTVFIETNGVSVAFKTNGRSWEIRDGIVVCSADMMLLGTAGQLLGVTPIPWVPLPPPIIPSALPVLSAPSGSGSLTPANTISLPGGFNPAAPGSIWATLPTTAPGSLGKYRASVPVIPAFLPIVPIEAVSRTIATVREYAYSLTPVTDSILAVSRSKVTVDPGDLVFVTRSLVTVTEVVVGTIVVGSITYSQSSTYPGNSAATNAGMTNGSYNTGTQTGVGYNSPFPWLTMDLGSVCSIASVTVGCDFDTAIPGGWGPNYTKNCDVEVSDDNATWSSLFNTGTFSSGIQTYSVTASGRYIRIKNTNSSFSGYSAHYMAVTEFYAES